MALDNVVGAECPLPLVVGVTGHRDLRPVDVPELERIVRDELESVQRHYPHSSLMMLSPLAEGADRVAARVALQLHIRLVVALPFARHLYERDFETEASRVEFVDLLGRASGHFELPLLPGHTEASIHEPGVSRDREYAKLGAFIACSSQILVALWDGRQGDAEKLGGTAQVVRFRLEGTPFVYDASRGSLTPPSPGGPVRHIVTPRHSRADLGFVPLTRRTLLPAGRTEESFTRLYHHIDGLNRDAHELRHELADGASRTRGYLLNAEPPAQSAALAALPEGCGDVLDQFTLADGLAVHFAGRTLATLRRVFIGVAVTALLFHLHASFFHVPETSPASLVEGVVALPWFLIACLACSAFTALWLHGRAEKAEYQAKHQDYRALAEALRIQFYWRVAGVSESVVDSFLRKQRSDLDWIRSALRSWHLLATMIRPSDSTPPVASPQRFGLLMHWISDQRAYFVRKATQEQQHLDTESAIVHALLTLGAGASVVLTLTLAVTFLVESRYQETLRHVLAPQAVQHSIVIVIGMFGVCAALCRAYGDQLARSEHVRQYTRMSELFDAAERECRRLVAEQRPDAVTSLVRELGVEALEDSADWLILHRERPLELPHA